MKEIVKKFYIYYEKVRYLRIYEIIKLFESDLLPKGSGLIFFFFEK
jgi:hypothetical protein